VVDLEAIADVAPFFPVRLFVGYAGWSPGQLTAELNQRDWFVADADPMDVLATDPDVVWEQVLRRQLTLTRLWATLPRNANVN
jgi:putative transcriptional regulator